MTPTTTPTTTPATAPATAPTATTAAPVRVRRPVSPEVASALREADDALAATIRTAQAMTTATIAAGNAAVASARERRDATLRPILRHLEIDGGVAVAIEGFGHDTVLVLDVPRQSEGSPDV